MRWLALAMVAVCAMVACQAAAPTERPAAAPTETPSSSLVDTGIVVSIDSPGLGRVDGFELLTPDGRRLDFDTTELDARAEFPISHLSEHQVLSDPIEVTYYAEGDRLIVIMLDDAA